MQNAENAVDMSVTIRQKQEIPYRSGMYTFLASVFSFPAVLVCSLSYLIFLFARRNVADPDLWWHLRNSQYLMTHHQLPVVDHYSFTAPGVSVLPFEWLAEIPYYFVFKWLGLYGVFLLVFFLSSIVFLGVFRLSYTPSGDLKNSFVFAVGGAVLSVVSSGARTLLFGWLYLVILLLLLQSIRSGAWRKLWVLPPLFCLWINSHGSWPMGIVVLGIFIGSGLFEGSWGNMDAVRWSGSQLRKLILVALASGAALFINPFGYRLVIYPFRVIMGAHSSVGSIQEFTSVDFQTPWGKAAMVLILGTLLIAVLTKERWRLEELGHMTLALYYSLTYIRFIFLAGILMPPIFARRVKIMAPYSNASERKSYNAAALLILLVLFIVSWPRLSDFQSPVQYPEAAVQFMKANGIHARVFNTWTWGGYLIWNAPEIQVFVDGRGDPYGGNGVMGDYLSATFGGDPQPVMDKYKIEYVLIPPDSSLAIALQRNSGWSIQFSDPTSVLFHRTAKL